MMFYVHSLAYKNGTDVDYDDEYELEAPPLKHPDMQVNEQGHRVINR